MFKYRGQQSQWLKNEIRYQFTVGMYNSALGWVGCQLGAWVGKITIDKVEVLEESLKECWISK